MIRVTGDDTANLLATLSRTQSEQDRALQEISTGKRISAPSDDPAGMATWLQIRSSTSQNDEFLHSISTLTTVLETADSALNSVVTDIERAVGLGVRGSTATLSQTDREQIAAEISGIIDDIAELANTSFRGTYLFAGTDVLKKPVVRDASSPSGWAYAGNSKVVGVEIGNGKSTQINIAGDQIFTSQDANVFEALSGLMTTLETGDTEACAAATEAARKAFDHVTGQRVFYGNALSRLEKQTDSLKAEQVQLESRENVTAGADLAGSITRFLNAQTARDAALSAAGKLSHLSLLDYLQ